MKLEIIVKPNAKKENVEKISENSYRVSVKAPPKEDKANVAVIAALADFFDVPKSHIHIVLGARNKKKVVKIL